MLLAATLGCAPVIKVEGASINPLLTAQTSLDPVVIRPRMTQQKSVYDRPNVPSTYFHPTAAAGDVRAPDDVELFVQIWHAWRELADLHAYEITLRADDGPPVPVDAITAAEVASEHDRLTTDGYRTTNIPVFSNGHVAGVFSMGSWEPGTVEDDLFRGRAVLHFRGRSLMTTATRKLSLELRHRRQIYLFVWHFAADPPPASEQKPKG